MQALHHVPELTPREFEVFRMLAHGPSSQAMADELYVSERTVRAHLGSIAGKLRLRSRLQMCLAAHAYRCGCHRPGNTVVDDNGAAA